MKIYESNRKHFQWIAERHANVNHLYDKYLPYEFHLRLSIQVHNEYKHLLIQELVSQNKDMMDIEHNILPQVELGIFGHDLLENTDVTYTELTKKFSSVAANIIYALTPEKGKTRKEKYNDKYHKEVLETEFALYSRLCERIANCRYGEFTNNEKKLAMYKDEYLHFLARFKWNSKHQYDPMFAEISKILLKDETVLN